MTTNSGTESTSDPSYHAANVQRMLRDLIQHLEDDQGRISEPRALALFEVSREVLKGLDKAFEDYQKKSEKPWSPQ